MTRIVTIAASGFAAILLAGCARPEGSESRGEQRAWFPRNVQGNWVLRDVNPPESAAAFTILAITFNPDQTYVARIVKEGNRLETNRGTYRYDEWNRKLFLHSGPDQRGYGAILWFGSELHMEGDRSQGQTGTAVMVRSNLRVAPEATSADRRKP